MGGAVVVVGGVAVVLGGGSYLVYKGSSNRIRHLRQTRAARQEALEKWRNAEDVPLESIALNHVRQRLIPNVSLAFF